ncbi:MAG: hypothetical protein M5U34_02285 [Chloroflexi bacterium]|nr:hypothetical protein [Chloroflexota bacterium]
MGNILARLQLAHRTQVIFYVLTAFIAHGHCSHSIALANETAVFMQSLSRKS